MTSIHQNEADAYTELWGSVSAYKRVSPGEQYAPTFHSIVKDAGGADAGGGGGLLPHLHERTFRSACKRAGLNPYLCELVSIREQVSWVHTDKAAGTAKSKAVVSGGVERVSHHEPLEPLRVPIHPHTLVVSGGVAWIQAALELADAGEHVYLVEREPSIGGHMAQFDKTFPTLDCSACILTPKMVDVGNHPNITLLTWSEVEKVDGYVGNFMVTVRKRALERRHLSWISGYA